LNNKPKQLQIKEDKKSGFICSAESIKSIVENNNNQNRSSIFDFRQSNVFNNK
jgi:hypothetical protein